MTTLSQRPIVVFVDGDLTRLESGSHVRFLEQLQFLQLHFDRITVYSYYENDKHPWDDASVRRFKNVLPGVQLVLDRRTRPLALFTRLKNFALMVLPKHASRILRCRLPGLTPNFDAIQHKAGSILFCNFVDGVTLVNGCRFGLLIIDTHDLKFVRAAKVQNREIYAARTLAKLRSELGVLSSVQALISISEAEREVFRILVEGNRQCYIPTFQTSGLRQDAKTSYKYDLLFVGSESNLNTEGLVGFLQENYGWLQTYNVAVAGTVCRNSHVVKSASFLPRLDLLGFVEDLPTLYMQSKLALSPVEGTGLKIKIVDALRHGTPVCASEHSRTALPPGYDGCVFKIERSQIEALLNSSDLLAVAEADAYSYFGFLTNVGDKLPMIEFLAKEPLAV